MHGRWTLPRTTWLTTKSLMRAMWVSHSSSALGLATPRSISAACGFRLAPGTFREHLIPASQSSRVAMQSFGTLSLLLAWPVHPAPYSFPWLVVIWATGTQLRKRGLYPLVRLVRTSGSAPGICHYKGSLRFPFWQTHYEYGDRSIRMWNFLRTSICILTFWIPSRVPGSFPEQGFWNTTLSTY